VRNARGIDARATGDPNMSAAHQTEREVSDKLISIHAILLVARAVLEEMDEESACSRVVAEGTEWSEDLETAESYHL
jgi:hypothetical protein